MFIIKLGPGIPDKIELLLWIAASLNEFIIIFKFQKSVDSFHSLHLDLIGEMKKGINIYIVQIRCWCPSPSILWSIVLTRIDIFVYTCNTQATFTVHGNSNKDSGTQCPEMSAHVPVQSAAVFVNAP